MTIQRVACPTGKQCLLTINYCIPVVGKEEAIISQRRTHPERRSEDSWRTINTGTGHCQQLSAGAGASVCTWIVTSRVSTRGWSTWRSGRCRVVSWEPNAERASFGRGRRSSVKSASSLLLAKKTYGRWRRRRRSAPAKGHRANDGPTEKATQWQEHAAPRPHPATPPTCKNQPDPSAPRPFTALRNLS